MDEKLSENQLKAVTGGSGNSIVPSYPPVKYRCVKCGYEFMMDEGINHTKIRCPKQFCDGAVIKVGDA